MLLLVGHGASSVLEGLPFPHRLVRATAPFRLALTRRDQQRLAEYAPGRADPGVRLRISLNETSGALVLIGLVIGHTDLRILEVGSGTGALSVCLVALGYDINGIEPGNHGFEDLVVLQEVISTAAADLQSDSSSQADLVILKLGVDDLDPGVHGRFDVVLSANVLEHVPDPISALERMQSVLMEDGVQRHVCPNYAFSYGPHFFAPQLPFMPPATSPMSPSPKSCAI